MTKARTLADFISDGSEFADGAISVAEVSGAAPTASPTFTGTINTSSGSTSADALKITGSGGNNFIHMVGNQGQTSFRMWENGAEDPAYFYMYHQGGEQHKIESKGGEAVIFNEKGLDLDFRIESDTESNAFFVDGGTGNIGIGDSAHTTYNVRIRESGDREGTLLIQNDNGTGSDATAAIRINAVGNNFAILNYPDAGTEDNITRFISTAGSSSFKFATASNDRMTIHSNGRVDIVGPNYSYANADSNYHIKLEEDSHNVYLSNVNGTLHIGSGGRYYGGQLRTLDSGETSYAGLAVSNDSGVFILGSSGHTAGQTNASTVTHHLFPTSGAVTFNETAADADFRIESDSKSNMLTVDAGEDRVNIGGVGTAGTSTRLWVQNENPTFDYESLATAIITATEARLQIAASDGGSHAAHLLLTTGSKHWLLNGMGPDSDNDFTIAYKTSTGDNQNNVSGKTDALIINRSGHVTHPLKPYFVAKRNSNVSWGNATFSWGTEIEDRGNDFNGTKFTAPVAGVYVFHLQLTILGGTTGQDDTMYWYFYKNGSAYQTMQDNWSYRLGTGGNGVEMNIAATAVIPLSVNDYVDFRTTGIATTTGVIHSASYFSGYLLG